MTRTCLMAVLLFAISGCGVASRVQSTARPTVRIISPASGAKLATHTVTVRLSVSNFTILLGGSGSVGSGQVWLYENGKFFTQMDTTALPLFLQPGTYALKAVLVTNGKPAASSAPVVVSVSFAPTPTTNLSTNSCATTPTPSSTHGLKVGTITLFCRGLPQLRGGACLPGITPGPDGSVWFTVDTNTDAIGRITPTGMITTFAKGLPANSSPQTIVAGADGNLWFTTGFCRNPVPGAIGRITAAGSITMFTRGLPPGSALNSLVASPDGNVWFTFATGGDGLYAPANAIGRITPSGVITLLTKGLGTHGGPDALVAARDGSLWFSDQLANGESAIGHIAPSGTITVFAKGLPPGLYVRGLGGLVVGPDGNLWFTEQSLTKGSGAIGRITPAGVVTMFTKGLLPGGYPSNITVGPGGNLWFTEQSLTKGSGAIGRITPAGTITLFSKGLPAASSPSAIIPGPDGNVWFTVLPLGYGTGAIGRITPAGTITMFARNLVAGSQPTSIVAGADGNLWFLDQSFTDQSPIGGSGAIGRIVP